MIVTRWADMGVQPLDYSEHRDSPLPKVGFRRSGKFG